MIAVTRLLSKHTQWDDNGHDHYLILQQWDSLQSSHTIINQGMIIIKRSCLAIKQRWDENSIPVPRVNYASYHRYTVYRISQSKLNHILQRWDGQGNENNGGMTENNNSPMG